MHHLLLYLLLRFPRSRHRHLKTNFLAFLLTSSESRQLIALRDQQQNIDPEEPFQDDPTLKTNVSTEPKRAHDPYRALRFHDFRLLFAGTFVASIGEQMLNVAIGWELYERTGSALALGFVGLVQVVPVILHSLPAGYLADRFSIVGAS